MSKRAALGAVVIAALIAGALVFRARPTSPTETRGSRGAVIGADGQQQRTVRTRWGLDSERPSSAMELPDVDREIDAARPAVVLEVQDFLGGPVAGPEALLNGKVIAVGDQDGFIRVPPPRRDQALMIRAQGYSPAMIQLASFGQFVVKLMPEASLAGAVITRTEHRPVPGIEVRVGAGEGATTVVTDDEGRFEIDGLGPGDYVVEATSSTHAGASDRIYVGLHGRRDDVVIEVDSAYTVSGKVAGSSDISDFEVVLSKEAHFMGTATRRARVESGGAFSLTGVPAGSYFAYVTSEESPVVISSPVVPVMVDRDRNDVLVQLPPLTTVAVEVRSPNGAPVRGAQVTGQYLSGQGSLSSISCETGDDGRCEIRELGAGRIEDLKAHDSQPGKAITLPAAGLVTLEAPDQGELLVMLADETGAPLPGHTVQASQGATSKTEFCDQQGRALIRGLSVGAVDVTVLAVDRTSAMSLLVDTHEPRATAKAMIAANQITELRVIAPRPQGRLQGVVRTGAGQVADAVLVALVRHSPQLQRGAFPADALANAMTDEGGRFVFEHVDPNGTYAVYALAPEGATASATAVAANTPIELQLRLPTELRVQFGVGFGNRIEVMRGDEVIESRVTFDGETTFFGLVPGAYRVRGTRDEQVVAEQNIRVGEGEKLDVDLGGR